MGSFELSLPLPRVEVGEGLICTDHIVSLGLRWGRGSFASLTVRLPLPCGGGGGAHL